MNPSVGQENILEMQSVSTYYGQVQALREVSLHVRIGEVVALLGANGAGKTTTLNAIYGILPPAQGEVFYDGQRISGLPPEKMAALRIGYVPEGRQLFAPMSVMDNLTLGAYSQCAQTRFGTVRHVGRFLRRPVFQSILETVFRLFPILRERQKQQAGSLSGGEQQMLAIGRALMSSPRMLLLDEPSLGLAPNLVREILQLMAKLRDEGLTILLIEQDAVAALKIADRGYVMERGRIVIEGSSSELLGNDQVRQAYLGKSVA